MIAVPFPTAFLQEGIRNSIPDNGAIDATVLQVALFKEAPPAAVNELTDWSALTEADFNSYARKEPTGHSVVFDPTDGYYYILLTEPAGGWSWITGTTANLPQTISAFGLWNTDLNEWAGGDILPTPVQLTAAAQTVNLGVVRWRYDSRLLSPTPGS